MDGLTVTYMSPQGPGAVTPTSEQALSSRRASVSNAARTAARPEELAALRHEAGKGPEEPGPLR